MVVAMQAAELTKDRWRLVAILILLAAWLAPRIGLIILAPIAPESDALAYIQMAEDLAAGRPMQDQWGQYAFYSAGYPILLGLVFIVGGASLQTVLMANLALSLLTLWLIIRVTRELGGSQLVQWLAGMGYALWIPAAYGLGLVQRENLSTPVLLTCLLSVLFRSCGRSVMVAAAICGLCFGYGLITGASGALIGLLFPLALWCLWRQEGFQKAAKAGAIAASALVLTVGPWLSYTHAQLGEPVLNSNSGFNFYLGNNPAANGTFVGIEKTPIGPEWKALHSRLGEVGAARQLQAMATKWISENPADAAALAARKLMLFWTPNFPDAADRAASSATYLLRWIDVAQFAIVVLLAVMTMLFHRKAYPAINWMIGAVALFWMLHAAAYVMPRYREPVMPMMIIMAAIAAGHILKQWPRKGVAHG